MRKLLLIASGFLIILLGSSCTSPTTPAAKWHGPEVVGAITEPVINEISGLARSPRTDNIFWVNNDSGGEPVLYAIDGKGRYLGSVRFEGATNYDWEDCASFKMDGKSYLVAADVGDNYAKREDCVLYLIAEPDPADLDPVREISAPLVRQIRFTFPGGPRDCESVSIDPVEGYIYLVSKRTVPPVVYRLPLSLDSNSATVVVETVGNLNGIPQPTGPMALLNTTQGKYRAQPCSMDISADQRTAVVLSYGEVYIYNREPSQSWAETFAREPIPLAAHNLPQAEGVCFTNDNQTVLVSTEGVGEPLLRYTVKVGSNPTP